MNSKSLNCLNCGSPLDNGVEFCKNCGQATKYKNLSLKFILASFFETFFNLDSRLFHSFKDIWRPNVITRSFIAGKRNYYVHPFRFYFVCLIVFFGLVSISVKNLDVDSNKALEKVNKYDLYAMIDTFKIEGYDECQQSVLDSLKSRTPPSIKSVINDTFISATIRGSDLEDYGISTFDALTMTNNELEEKYKINKRLDKLVINQYRHMLKDQETFIRKGIANLLWGILLLTAIMALILKILYFRHSSYYIEHLLHITHFHSLLFLICSILFGLNLINSFEFFDTALSIAIMSSILYLLVSLKRYYNQGLFVTLFKMLILGFGYIFGISIILVIIGIFTFIFA